MDVVKGVSGIHLMTPGTSNYIMQELAGPTVSALRRAIAEFKLRWSVIARVNKNLLSQAPPCFGRHVKSVPAFAVVSTHESALTRGLWLVLLMCNP
jgi:hypothetical protein